MRAHAILLIGAALMAACSSHKNDAPTACAKPHGLYFVTFETVSGNCGDIPAEIVNLDVPDPGCIDNPTQSTDSCHEVADTTCPADGGGQVHIVGYTVFDDANGDMLHGTATFTITDPTGRMVCLGTYNAKWVRQ